MAVEGAGRAAYPSNSCLPLSLRVGPSKFWLKELEAEFAFWWESEKDSAAWCIPLPKTIKRGKRIIWQSYTPAKEVKRLHTTKRKAAT
jgi:hypothetical protein